MGVWGVHAGNTTFRINADTGKIILWYLVTARVETAGKRRKVQKSNRLNSSYSHKINLAFSCSYGKRVLWYPAYRWARPYTRIRTRERTTELLTLQMNHSYIHYSYFKKKDLVSLFSPFALNTACIKATRHKELRCLSTNKSGPYRESKGRQVRKRREIHSNSPTSNDKHLKRSHALHCTSLSHSSVDYRVTTNVGFHRNNKTLRKQSANTAAIIEMWQIVKFLKIPQRW